MQNNLYSNHWAILKGKNSQHYITVRRARVGRDIDHNEVILLSQSISKRHCVLECKSAANVILTDLNSRNGTFVNHKRIQNASIKIKNGDILRFGFDSNNYAFELNGKSIVTDAYTASYATSIAQPSINQTSLKQLPSQNNKGLFRAGSFMLGSQLTAKTVNMIKNKNNSNSTPNLLKTKYNAKDMEDIKQHHKHENRIKMRDINTTSIQTTEFDTNVDHDMDGSNISTAIIDYSLPISKNQNETVIKKLEKKMEQTLLRLENKIENFASVSKQQKSDHNLRQPPNIKHFPIVLRNNIKNDLQSMEKLKEIEQQKNETKMKEFYDTVERLSIDKSLQLLNMKIQYIVHLFNQTVSKCISILISFTFFMYVQIDEKLDMRTFLDFSNEYKKSLQTKQQQISNNEQPALSDFVKIMEYMNGILNSNKCQSIYDWIKNIDSQITFLHSITQNKAFTNDTCAQSRAIQVTDTERENSLAIAHSMKEYSASLQQRIYQLRQILVIKDNKITELSTHDWCSKLQNLENLNCSLQRQILLQDKECKNLYQMFSELSEKIDRNLPDSNILRSKISDFMQTYNKKIFNLTSELSEEKRRKSERTRNWNTLTMNLRRCQQKVLNLENIIKTQRCSMNKLIEEKNTKLLQTTKELSIVSSFSETNDSQQKLAAKFLFETLSKYINENKQQKYDMQLMGTSMQLKVSEFEELKEKYERKLNDCSSSMPMLSDLELQLREEKEHNGAQRISMLEQTLFCLQTKYALLSKKSQEILNENRKLSENTALNELETIEFLSKSLHTKNEHLHKLQLMIEKQNLKIKELTLAQERFKSERELHEKEIQDMQQKQQRLSRQLILGVTANGNKNMDHMIAENVLRSEMEYYNPTLMEKMMNDHPQSMLIPEIIETDIGI